MASLTRQVRRGLLAVALIAPGITTAESIQVVTNTDVPVKSLPVASLRAIFSMRVRNWPDGQPVRVFVLPDRDDLHLTFSKEVLHVYPYVLRDTWDRMIFTGTGQTPIEVANEQQLLQLVAETPGAIGYGREGIFSHETIKVLEIR